MTNILKLEEKTATIAVVLLYLNRGQGDSPPGVPPGSHSAAALQHFTTSTTPTTPNTIIQERGKCNHYHDEFGDCFANLRSMEAGRFGCCVVCCVVLCVVCVVCVVLCVVCCVCCVLCVVCCVLCVECCVLCVVC
jgi:hypothetical protein